MASVLVPVLYLAVLVGSLLLFSNYYRKRVASRLADNPWFPSHPDRDTYVTLLQQRDPAAPEVLLKAALLRRAVADVHRIMRIKEDKGALNNLIQKGAVGDDLWTRFLATEKELEAEIVEVISEANSFREGWGQIIFQTASEIVNNEKTREMYANLNRAKTAVSQKTASSKLAIPTASASASATTSPARTPVPLPNGSTPVKTDAASLLPSAPTSEVGDATTPSTPGTPTGSVASRKGKKRK